MNFPARAKTFLASIVLRQRLLSRWAHKRLPAKRMATCVLFFDEGDRLLVVKPTYRKDWLLPGGTVERDESPWDGARREVLEEIGLEVGQLHLAAVDWRGPDDHVDECMHFAFYGGIMAPDQQAAIRPDGVEIADYRFVDRESAEDLLFPQLYRRARPCWDRHADSARPLILNSGQEDPRAF